MDALVTHACSRNRNGDSSSISSRSQGVYVLEILRGSAKVASRVKALFVHFHDQTELLTALALRVFASLGMCAKYCEGQQKWAQARTQFFASLQADGANNKKNKRNTKKNVNINHTPVRDM